MQDPLSIPLLAYRSWYFSQQRVRYLAFSRTMLAYKLSSLTTAANLTLGEVIWLLFELVLIVLRIINDKTTVTYIKSSYIILHFNVDLFKVFLYKKACRIPSHPTACLTAVCISSNKEFAIGTFSSTGLVCSILSP